MLDHSDIHLQNGVCDAQTNGSVTGNTEQAGLSGKVNAFHVQALAALGTPLLFPLYAVHPAADSSFNPAAHHAGS